MGTWRPQTRKGNWLYKVTNKHVVNTAC